MSVPFGVDLGNFSSVIGIARNRGIDVVVNEVSNRSTPSLVGFGVKSRYLGEQAKSNETSNLKNTVGSLKRLVGKSFADPNVEVEKKFLTSQLTDVNGLAGVQVNFQGKQHTFDSTQLVAMYLNKLKNITIHEAKAPVNDIVLAVPVWYTETARRAVADAAVIANLNPVRVVNDVTAAAVGYGVFRTDLPEDKAKIVAICDMGHSSFTVSICAFKKGELKVLGTAYDKHFGGRDVDLIIANHFADVFKEKYKIDVKTHPKAWSRVLSQSERLKKILSANTSAPFNIESLMNDIDVSSSMTRDELESYLAPFIERVAVPIEQALKMAGVTKEQLDAVELIGGNSRIPCVKDQIAATFNSPLSFTLNQDEAIARGAAFICAIHSPTVRVRPFKFEDINLHSVTYSWDKVEGEDLSELEVFPAGGHFPNTKVITLFRSNDFSVQARYTHPETLETGTSANVGKWHIKGVQPSSTGEPMAVKIKLRHDPSGLFQIESAYTAEEVTEEVPIEEEQTEKDAAAEGAEEEPKAEVKTKTVKKWVKRADLVITHEHIGLSEDARARLMELESQMTSDDKLVADTEDRKNALEEYIYYIRSKIEEEYADFASDDEKTRLREKCDAAEDWLYGDGEDATKAQYIAKYEELASIGNLIKGRYNSKIEEERQAKLAKQEAEKQRLMAEKIQKQQAEAKAKADAEAKPESEDTEMADA